jgi:cell division protein FtsB
MRLNLQFKRRSSTSLVVLFSLCFAFLTAGCGGNPSNDSAAASDQELEKLREENKEVKKLQTENQELPQLRKENLEVLKLRGQTEELAKLRKENEELRAQIAQFQQTNRAARPSGLKPAQP